MAKIDKTPGFRVAFLLISKVVNKKHEKYSRNIIQSIDNVLKV